VNKSIPLLVQDLKSPDRQQDINSISDLFHAHGVNMRYLGAVAKLIDPNEFPSVYMQMERTCLTKALKHIFRQAMRETS
jgi:protein TIF31